MSKDDAVIDEMSRQTEDPRSARKVEPKYTKSKFTPKALKEKAGDKVWVKCVSECKPWANDQPMDFWEDYHVSIEDAILLDERRFAVILEEPL